MWNKYFVSIVFCLLIINSVAQKSNRVVVGTIKNKNGEAIENAHIYGNRGRQGVISNYDGFFQIKVPNTTDTLLIKHVSYKEQMIRIVDTNVQRNSIYFEIVLEINLNYLQSIDIVESKRWLVLNSNQVWIYDYELVGNDEILLLLKDTVKFELHYLNVANNTVCKIAIKNNSFCKLFKDGLGNTNIALNDSIYQIFLCNKLISFYKGVSKKEYRDIILPIVAKTESIFVMKELSLNNQKLVYYSIYRNTQKKALIAEIFCQEKYKNSLEVKKQQMSYFGINHMGELTIEELHIRRLYFQWGQYFENIATQPFYSPIIQFGECVCVFDLINNKMSFFNSKGKQIREKDFTFSLNKKVYLIQVDKVAGKFYSLWKKHGIVHVDNINMQTGEVAKTYRLANYLNPEKVQFRNGYIYFLYSDYNFNKKLFKMPMSQLPNQ